jgi:hypothetical protein
MAAEGREDEEDEHEHGSVQRGRRKPSSGSTCRSSSGMAQPLIRAMATDPPTPESVFLPPRLRARVVEGELKKGGQGQGTNLACWRWR